MQHTNSSEYELSETVNPDEYKHNQKVSGYVFKITPMGLKICFDEKYLGIIYNNEVYGNFRVGQEVEVYIKYIRPDFRVDLSLRPTGFKFFINEVQEAILKKLEESGGELMLSDKSSPEQIKQVLGISKKKFKDGIGGLFKAEKIDILDDRIVKL